MTSDLIGVVIVDHGSRKAASNDMLLAAVEQFRLSAGHTIVEPAHMELAQPDVATAFDRCVSQGATRVVIFPYFLSPGRHWSEDIPALAAAAAQRHPEVSWIVTAPFGLHSGMTSIIADRIQHCLIDAQRSERQGCDVCRAGEPCRISVSEETDKRQ